MKAGADLDPEAVAVTLGVHSITYRQLLERGREVARRLPCATPGREGFVGVVVDRSVDALTGLIGAALAGLPYVPVASDWPAERLLAVCQAAAISVVTGSSAGALGGAAPDLCLSPDLIAARSGAQRAGTQAGWQPTEPSKPAYAIFTSGSTGTPKGVVVSQRSVVHSTLARFSFYPHENMVYLMLAPFTIDSAIAGIYFALSAGARLVVPTEEEVLDPQLLADLITGERVTHVDGLPSQYAPLLMFYPEALSDLRCVILGGESLPITLMRQHLSQLPHVPLHNEYGPTEGTVWSTSHLCSESDGPSLVPIGKPIAGVRATVLDDQLRPAPVGTVGEIYISGVGLAMGYLGPSSLTAERFVANPDSRYPGERMYRTGDLGSATADGALVYHGRTDHLVKVRGYRVELAEVEAKLLDNPDLAEAVVVPYEGATGLRLCAVVVSARDRATSSDALAAHLSRRLPRYMIPTVWRQVDRLPRTASGKLDRSLLRTGATTVGSALPANTASRREARRPPDRIDAQGFG